MSAIAQLNYGHPHMSKGAFSLKRRPEKAVLATEVYAYIRNVSPASRLPQPSLLPQMSFREFGLTLSIEKTWRGEEPSLFRYFIPDEAGVAGPEDVLIVKN